MATVVVEVDSEPSCSIIPNPAASTSPSLSHRFLDSKFYLLVVVGELVTEEHLRRAIANIERGEGRREPGRPSRQRPRHPPAGILPLPGAAIAPPNTHPPIHPSRRLFIPWGGGGGGENTAAMPRASLFPGGAGMREERRAPCPPRRGGGAGPGWERHRARSARRHRRVGVARSAVRSPRQPRGGQRAAGDAVDGLGWVGLGMRGGCCPQCVYSPEPGGGIGAFSPLGSAAAPLCL